MLCVALQSYKLATYRTWTRFKIWRHLRANAFFSSCDPLRPIRYSIWTYSDSIPLGFQGKLAFHRILIRLIAKTYRSFSIFAIFYFPFRYLNLVVLFWLFPPKYGSQVSNQRHLLEAIHILMRKINKYIFWLQNLSLSVDP